MRRGVSGVWRAKEGNGSVCAWSFRPLGWGGGVRQHMCDDDFSIIGPASHGLVFWGGEGFWEDPTVWVHQIAERRMMGLGWSREGRETVSLVYQQIPNGGAPTCERGAAPCDGRSEDTGGIEQQQQ